jgi:hypothetical protein
MYTRVTKLSILHLSVNVVAVALQLLAVDPAAKRSREDEVDAAR